MDRDARVARMGEVAKRRFSLGYCCSEAMVLAAIDVYVPEADKRVIDMVSGLCGGMGNKRATCGVFTGGAAALGLVAQGYGGCSGKCVRKASSDFHQQLERLAGGQLCGDLLASMGVRNWNKSQCRELTRKGAVLLASIIEEQVCRSC